MKRVYFARVTGTLGPIKIGCSSYPKGRCKQLACDLAAKVEIIAEVTGDYTLERNLHLKFAESRADAPKRMGRPNIPGKSEWFHAVPELLRIIESAKSRGTVDLPIEERREWIFARRYLAGETLEEIATDYGITRERVRQVLRKIGVPSLGHRPEHRNAPHPLTSGEMSAAAEYARGELPKDVCAKYGLQRPQLLAACRRLGVEIRKPGAPHKSDYEETCASVTRLYRNGASLNEIRKTFGWSHVTYVYKWLQRAGVKPDRRSAQSLAA